MRIIFFGSADFSLPIIKTIQANFEVVGVVITKPKPKGRGLKVILPKVAEWANSCGLQVFDPHDPNDLIFINELAGLKPDLYVLSAYGHILSGQLLKIPKYGGINVHPSLLPKYRGAAPIQRVIMAGEKTTGITIFFMDEKIDHGEIIAQKTITIEPAETYGLLSQRLSLLAEEIMVDIIKSIEDGSCPRIGQDDTSKLYAPKLQKDEMIINWREKTDKIFNLIRALSPSPGAKTLFRGRELAITSALPADKKIEPAVCHIENRNIYVGTADGSVILKELKPENKNRISGSDFINGFRIKEGERFG